MDIKQKTNHNQGKHYFRISNHENVLIFLLFEQVRVQEQVQKDLTPVSVAAP